MSPRADCADALILLRHDTRFVREPRHCERSEAIQGPRRRWKACFPPPCNSFELRLRLLDCFASLAMAFRRRLSFVTQ
jgi:hypothetical protein